MKLFKIITVLGFSALFLAGCARSVGPCYLKYCKAKPVTSKHQPKYTKNY